MAHQTYRHHLDYVHVADGSGERLVVLMMCVYFVETPLIRVIAPTLFTCFVHTMDSWRWQQKQNRTAR